MAKKEKIKPTKLEKWFRTMRRFYRFFLRFVYPYKVYGIEKKLNDGPYLIVGNHLHIMDVIPAAISTDKPVHYMAKKELFEKGFMKWFTAKCECIPVNRDGNDVRALMTAMRYLKEGGIVNIFPEGTRNKTKDMFLPLKSGSAALSIKTKTPIVIMIQVKKVRKFRRNHVYFSQPFEFTEYYDKKLTQEDIAVCDEILRSKMEECYRTLEQILSDKKKKKNKK